MDVFVSFPLLSYLVRECIAIEGPVHPLNLIFSVHKAKKRHGSCYIVLFWSWRYYLEEQKVSLDLGLSVIVVSKNILLIMIVLVTDIYVTYLSSLIYFL